MEKGERVGDGRQEGGRRGDIKIFCLFVCYFVFETGFLCVTALAILELTCSPGWL